MTLRKHSPIRRDKWLRENADAITEYNRLIENLGVFASKSVRQPRRRAEPTGAKPGRRARAQ
jgi:hypothetical protein